MFIRFLSLTFLFFYIQASLYGLETITDSSADQLPTYYDLQSRLSEISKENLELKSELLRIQNENKNSFTYHKPNYMLPYSWQSDKEDRLHEEARFQLSIKQHLFDIGNLSIYAAYTQKSFWQIYDLDNSRPFRETNYNPEAFIKTPAYPIGNDSFWAISFGFEHESNGEIEPVSRSWDRLFLRSEYQWGPLHLILKAWYRIPEKTKEYPEDPKGDENPDILDYYGYGELVVNLNLEAVKFSFYSRYNASHKKGAFEANMYIPVTQSGTSIMLQYWDGYGDSLIDYNRHLNRYGIGIAVTSWDELAD